MVKTDDLAKAQGIPAQFLVDILANLRADRLVRSHRGRDGGYELGRLADQVSIADVLRCIDGPLASVRDIGLVDLPYSGPTAALTDVWRALRASMRSVLEETTLADVARGTLCLSTSNGWRVSISFKRAIGAGAVGRRTSAGVMRVETLGRIGPNWFASVMGTGIVATAGATLPVAVPGLHTLTRVVWVIAALLLAGLTVLVGGHWLRNPTVARSHADNPRWPTSTVPPPWPC